MINGNGLSIKLHESTIRKLNSEEWCDLVFVLLPNQFVCVRLYVSIQIESFHKLFVDHTIKINYHQRNEI